ncbi:MAG: hypothetical protein PHU95_05465 [Candidatus Thermoplasmatota archaeon]|nr:hypothetical protein [Candidatus Thermoplasmatota archaeon]MDD5778874.1 hypothetical protein [Candidatus Thermoplasmatota archaeon]
MNEPIPSVIKGQVAMKGMEVAGAIINTVLTRPRLDRHQEISNDYFDRLAELARQEARSEVHREMGRYGRPGEDEQRDERYSGVGGAPPSEGLEKGTACLACSKNHFSTASAALGEAVRFARTGGLSHPEAIRRIGIAIDELNICERIDLAPDAIDNLQPHEQEMAHWALEQSRTLRHMLDELRDKHDLEKAAAKAAELRNDYLRRLFTLTGETVDVEKVTEKVCARYTGEKRQDCEKAVQEFFEKK